jgi:hypothetical protein
MAPVRLPISIASKPTSTHSTSSGMSQAILHGSSGVDARGDFHQEALNEAGIATLQIDMWQARGVSSAADRPKAADPDLPRWVSALAFLAARPEIDAKRIGVLGFSCGGVMSLAASETLCAGDVWQRPAFQGLCGALSGVLRGEQGDCGPAAAGAVRHAVLEPDGRAGADPTRRSGRP